MEGEQNNIQYGSLTGEGKKALFRDVFNLHEKYKNTSTESEWSAMLDEVKALEDKYAKRSIIVWFLRGVMAEIGEANFPSSKEAHQC